MNFLSRLFPGMFKCGSSLEKVAPPTIQFTSIAMEIPSHKIDCILEDEEKSSNAPEQMKVVPLRSVQWKDTVIYIPPVTGGLVIKIYDGDTITIATKLPYMHSPIYRFSVRLHGIDTPEMKSQDIREKKLAYEARMALSYLIMDKYVELKNVTFEKYGRLLADVYCEDIHVNQWMIDHKYAVKYDGGKKGGVWS